MSIDEDKNDSLIILPKIHSKEKSIIYRKENEEDDKVWIKNLLNLNNPKPIITNSSSHFNLNSLYKSLKLNKEENTNDKTELTTTNFTPIKNDFNKKINPNYRINIIECEFNKYLNSTKQSLPEMKSNKSLIKERLDLKNDMNKIIYKYKKKLNKEFMIKNKLIANRIKHINLWNKDNSNKSKFCNIMNHSTIFNHTSINMAFSNNTLKSNKSMTNINHDSNITYKKQNIKKFHDSFNGIEPKNLSFHKNKNNKSKEKKLFICKLHIKPIKNIKAIKNIKLKNTNYIKKWNLPKTFSFGKLMGRQKEMKKIIKFHFLERMYEYNPKYNYVECNDKKAYLKYNPDLKNDFNTFKKNITRKSIYNHIKIMNNSAYNYNIINILNERKLEKQKNLEKKILNKILEEFIYYNKKLYNVKKICFK